LETKRDFILAAARELFLAHGVDGTSMEQVRVAAGVSNGSLFHHFPTKDALAAAAYLESTASLQRAIIEALTTPASPQRALVTAIEAHLRWVGRHPADARFLHEMRRTPAIEAAGQRLADLNAETLAAVRGWLDDNVAAGAVRALPLNAFLCIVFGPVMEFTRGWLKDPRPKRITDAAPLLGDAAWRAVRTDRAPGTR
jgi:AcrR family transcriptional regulator